MKSQDPDVLVLLDALARLGADPVAVERARQAGQLGALVVETAATGGAGVPFPDAAALAGCELDRAAELWRALGFSDPLTHTSVLPDEVRLLKLMTTASADLLGPEGTLRIARVIGEATSKMGDAVVGAFREQVEAPSRVAGAPYADTVRAYADLVAAALPGLQEAVGACVRRHVVQAAAGTWTLEDGDPLPRRDLVVGFVDLTGWTALSRALGHSDLARRVLRFEQLVATAAAAHGVRVVKLLGDGAMIVAVAADSACRFALDLIVAVDADETLPPVRVGLAAGSVLPSDGDYHGSTVNLAARLVAVAEPATALTDDAVRERAHDVAFHEARMVALRGLDGAHRAHEVLATVRVND